MRSLITILFSFGLCAQFVFGQSSISIEYAQNFTSFRYVDQTGTKSDNMQYNFSDGLNIGYRYLIENGVFFSGSFGLRQGGASYVYDDFNYRWDLNYAESRLGLGYMYNLGDVSVHISTQGYAGYLYKAEQRLHQLTRNILTEGSMKEWDFGLFFTPGIAYDINDKVQVKLNANYMLGLYNIETDVDQSTKNSLIGSAIGFNFKL